MTYGPVYLRNVPGYFRGLLRQTSTLIKKMFKSYKLSFRVVQSINFYFKFIFDILSLSPSKPDYKPDFDGLKHSLVIYFKVRQFSLII